MQKPGPLLAAAMPEVGGQDAPASLAEGPGDDGALAPDACPGPQHGPATIHASCVADGPHRALLILGPSGSGKSSLALQLIGLGLSLVADDRTMLQAEGEALMASAPPAITGLIEARGTGILRCPALPRARIRLAVDLAQPATERLPPHRGIVLCGCSVPLAFAAPGPHLASALVLALRYGRAA